MIHAQNKMSLEGEAALWKGSIPTRALPQDPGRATAKPHTGAPI